MRCDMVSSSDQSAIGGLLQWLLQNGSEISPNLEFKVSEECGGTLGCFATADFNAGDLLFSVPQKCMISIEEALSSSFIEMVRSSVRVLELAHLLSAELIIWLFMIYSRWERNETHYVYLRSLSEESPCPLNWPAELLDAMIGTNIESSCRDDSVSSNILLLKELNSHLGNDAFPGEVFNKESLKWAKGHYISRRYPNKFSCGADREVSSFSREKGLDDLGTLVPLLDILNHKADEEWLHMIVRDNKLLGGELYSNYGSLSNERLLYAYGYATPNNPHDSVAMKLMSKGTPSTNGSGKCIPRSHEGTFYVGKGGMQGVPTELWHTLSRIYQVQEDGLQGQTGDTDEEEGVEVDVESCELLLEWVTKKLSLFASLEESSKLLLESWGSDPRARSIVAYLEGQQEVLNDLLEDLQSSLVEVEEDQDIEQENEQTSTKRRRLES